MLSDLERNYLIQVSDNIMRICGHRDTEAATDSATIALQNELRFANESLQTALNANRVLGEKCTELAEKLKAMNAEIESLKNENIGPDI